MKILSSYASGRIVCHDAQQEIAGLLQSSDKSGYYLLKDGSVSPWTVYDQEWGVLIDEHLCLSLKMSKTRLSAREVSLYCQTLGVKLPSLYQICRYGVALKKINASLQKIGMGDFGALFADSGKTNVFRDIWYQEAVEDPAVSGKRFCILINKLSWFEEPSCELIDGKYMLYDKSMLYKFEENKYVPVPLKAVLRWEDLDFFSVETEGISYDFYRGKDLALVYLGQNVEVEFLDKELVFFNNTLWQNQDGKLYKIEVFGNGISYRRDVATDTVEISLYGEYTLDGISQDSWTDIYSFRKNGKGRYVQVSHKQV